MTSSRFLLMNPFCAFHKVALLAFVTPVIHNWWDLETEEVKLAEMVVFFKVNCCLKQIDLDNYSELNVRPPSSLLFPSILTWVLNAPVRNQGSSLRQLLWQNLD